LNDKKQKSTAFGNLATDMTSPFLDFLSGKPLPGFALLKNTRIENILQKGLRIAAFSEAHWSETYAPLKAMLPVAQLLPTREAREQASFKFSEDALKQQEFQFDDMPLSLTNESSDWELFGESYTIFWVVPADADQVIALLLSDLQAHSPNQISADQLKQLWEEKVNRIFFHYTEDVDVVLHAQLQEDLHEQLIEAINALPNAPEESSWDVLNEDVFWGDDDY
jgi:hypothetical protein